MIRAEFKPSGILVLMPETGTEHFALLTWGKNSKLSHEIVAPRDSDYSPISVELTKIMREERDAYRAFQRQQKQNTEPTA